MKRIWTKIYVVSLYILMLIGIMAVLALSIIKFEENRINAILLCAAGFILSLIISPVVHECGHIFFSHIKKMKLEYAKFSFLRIYEKEGKKKIAFANPFAPDETQVIPYRSGNMKKRLIEYSAGGLIFNSILIFIILIAAVLCLIYSPFISLLFWSILPYPTYLLLLNLPPFEYPSGKTDGKIIKELKKGTDYGQAFINVMEIYGRLYEGESYGKIEPELYSSFPQFAEDDTMYSVILSLKYKYYLETNQMNKAGDCLNRLAASAEYLTTHEVEELAAELVYMHSINGNAERAGESGKMCEEYLKGNTALAKRALTAYSSCTGHAEHVTALKEQWIKCIENEPCKGIAEFEKILFDRI